MSGSQEIFHSQWPGYIEKIQEADTSHIEVCLTSEGETNFIIKNREKLFYVHSQQGALKEAANWFQSLSLRKDSETLFVYGIGAGHAFLAAKKWLDENENRLLFFFEDDFALLSKFLETDLSFEILNHVQVLVVPFDSKIKTCEIRFSHELEMLLYTAINSSYQLVFSKFYSLYRPEFCAALRQFVYLRIGDFKWLMNFCRIDMVRQWFSNISHNLLALPEMLFGEQLFGKFTDVPVMICAAGPSIESQLPRLKQMKNRALFFGAGTGMNTLNRQGILPHFGCGIDPNISSESRLKTNTAFEIPYFISLPFNDKAQELLHGPQLFFKGSDTYNIMGWFIEKLGLEMLTQLNFVISTTCACMVISEKLACNPIVFTGLDLSYTGDKRYTEDVQAHPVDAPAEDFLIKNLPKKELMRAENLLGNAIYTRIDWINEGTYYTQYADQYSDLQFINATQEGLLLKGMPHKTLDELLSEELNLSYDLDNWVHAEVINAPKMELTKENIHQQLAVWERSLLKCKEVLIAMIKDLLDADEKLTTIPDSFKTQSYKRLLDQLTQEDVYQHFLKLIDEGYQKLSMRECIKFLYHPGCYNQEELYEKKLEVELVRLRFLHDYVQEQIKVLDEVPENSSPVFEMTFVPNKEEMDEGYVFEQGRFSIDDPSLDLHYKDAFSPKLLDVAPRKIEKESQRFFAEFIDGVPDGECVMYDSGGWLKARWYYKKGKLHGPSSFYTKEGKLLARGWFIDDERQGKNWQYYPSGQLYSIQRFVDGILKGKQEYYYEHGSLKSVFQFSKGCLEGKVELFYPNGKIKRESTFHKGSAHGKEKHWSLNSMLVEESEFDNGVVTGLAKSWHKSGQLKMEKVYLDSPEHYDLRRWNEEGKLIYEKRYEPKGLGEESVEKGTSLSKAVGQLKRKMEGLKEGLNE